MFNLGQLQPGQQFPLVSSQPLGVGVTLPQFGQLGGHAPGGSTAGDATGSMNAPAYQSSSNVPPQVSGSMNVPAAIGGFGLGLPQQQPVDGFRTPPATTVAFPMQQPQPMESFQFGIEAPAFNFGNFAFNAAPTSEETPAPLFGDKAVPGGAFSFGAEAPIANDIGSYKATESAHVPRFGEPGYKSPFDMVSTFESPFTYKSPFDDEKPSNDEATKDAGFSYATPQVASTVDNGPWNPPPVDEALLQSYRTLTETSLGDCWIRAKKVNDNNSQRERPPLPRDEKTMMLLPEKRDVPQYDEVYQEDQDPWSKPAVLKSKEETDAFWSQNPQAVRVRAALFAPKKHEESEETDWSFLGKMMRESVGSWIQETASSIPSAIRKSAFGVEDIEPVTRGVALNNVQRNIPETNLDIGRGDARKTEKAWLTEQMGTMPLYDAPTDRTAVRHWWSCKTVMSEDKVARKFTDKAISVDHPKDCSELMPEALLRSFGISAACKKGTKDAPNHDGFAICRFDESYMWGPLTMYCVLDGHGPEGEKITQVCVDMLPKLLFEHFKKLAPNIPREGLGYVRTPEELEHVRSTVEDVFVTLQQFLEQLTIQGGVCSRTSGATATLLLQGVERDVHGNEDPWLLVGHVGDSRACLLRPSSNDSEMRTGRDFNSESPEVLELTRDHRPDNQREKARIEQAGARVEAFSVEKGTVRPMDPRVLSDGQTWPALNMSRCLGDLFSHTQGVTELPEVRIKDVQFGDKVIICTDGVWDVISPSEAQAIIQDVEKRQPGTYTASEAITNEARKRWIEKTGDFFDDITCLVVDVRSF